MPLVGFEPTISASERSETYVLDRATTGTGYYYYYYYYYNTADVTLVENGNGHPITYHEGTEGEYRYCCTLSLTLAVEGLGGQRHVPAALPRDKTR